MNEEFIKKLFRAQAKLSIKIINKELETASPEDQEDLKAAIAIYEDALNPTSPEDQENLKAAIAAYEYALNQLKEDENI